MASQPPRPPLFPYTTLFRSAMKQGSDEANAHAPKYLLFTDADIVYEPGVLTRLVSEAESKSLVDRKSTRLNSSHLGISYAVFCLKKTTALKTGVNIGGYCTT